MGTLKPARTAPLAPETVEDFLQAVARRVEPACIVLFGSYARGTPRLHSDLDLLVVMEADAAPRDRTDPFRDLVREVPADVDVLVRTPAEVRYWRGTPNHIIHEAFQTGTVAYRAPGADLSFPTRPRPMEMAREFLRKAENDLTTARAVLQMEDGPTDTPAFHAQQAAEKGLKAILTFRQIDAPYTHDLGSLLDLVPEGSEQRALLSPRRAGLEAISKYGVETRYPASEEPTREEARRALRVAEEVMRVARAQVERGGSESGGNENSSSEGGEGETGYE